MDLSLRPAFVKGVEKILGSNNPQTAWHPWIKATFKSSSLTTTAVTPAAVVKAVPEKGSPKKMVNR